MQETIYSIKDLKSLTWDSINGLTEQETRDYLKYAIKQADRRVEHVESKLGTSTFATEIYKKSGAREIEVRDVDEVSLGVAKSALKDISKFFNYQTSTYQGEIRRRRHTMQAVFEMDGYSKSTAERYARKAVGDLDDRFWDALARYREIYGETKDSKHARGMGSGTDGAFYKLITINRNADIANMTVQEMQKRIDEIDRKAAEERKADYNKKAAILFPQSREDGF